MANMRIGEAVLRCLRMGLTRPLVVLALALALALALLLAVLFLLAGNLLVVCIYQDRPRSHAELKEQAEIGVKEVGGAGVLGKEAKAILSNDRARPGEGSYGIVTDTRNNPATVKLWSHLWAPAGRDAWVAEAEDGLPAHVVLRFGSHAHYAYLWMFDPADMPLGEIEGVEHLSGAVYLSERNRGWEWIREGRRKVLVPRILEREDNEQ